MNGQELSAAWNTWLSSDQGQKLCRDSAAGEYLKNRLWFAFMAGVKAHEDAIMGAGEVPAGF